MELVAVPSRVLRTVSAWCDATLILVGGLTAALPAIANSFTKEQLAAAVGALGAISLFAKFVRQNIAVTPEQKVAMVQAAVSSPVKGGDDPYAAVELKQAEKGST